MKCLYKKLTKKYIRVKELNLEICTFSFHIVQKEHEYGSLKCEPSGSKLDSCSNRTYES